MRCVYVAGWSSPHNLATDSTLSWFKGWVWPWVKATPDVYLFMTIPGGPLETKSRNVLEEFLAHPRIEALPTGGSEKRQYREFTMYQPELELFDEVRGQYPWLDAVLTDRPAALSQMIVRTQSYTIRGGVRRAYATSMQFLFDRLNDFIHRSFRRSQAVGWAESDLILWHSEENERRGLAEGKQWMSSFDYANFVSNSRRYVAGLQFDEIIPRALPASARSDSPVTLVWGTSLNRNYQPELVFGVADKLYQSGAPLAVRCITSSALVEGDFKIRQLLPETSMAWVDFYFKLSQGRFWDLAAPGHFFVNAPLVSELTYGAFELAILGLVGLHQDRPAIVSTLVPGYPYTFKSREDLYVLMRRMVVDREWKGEEAQRWVRVQNEFILDTFAGSANWPRFAKEFDALASRQVGWTTTLRPMIEEATAPYDELSLEQFAALLRNHMRQGYDILGAHPETRYALSKNMYRRLLIETGWRDTCSERTPHFIRVEDAHVRDPGAEAAPVPAGMADAER